MRRPLVAVASLLLVVVSVAAFTSLYAHAGGRVSVLAVAHDVTLGQVIEANDVVTARISVSSGLSTIPARDVGDVVGHRAGVDLEKGTLLAFDELGGKALPSGQAVVGVATKVGELPAEGVSPGESVEVVLTDPAGATGQAGATQGAVDEGGSASAPLVSGSGGTPTAFGSVVVTNAIVTAVADGSSGDGTVVVSVLLSLDVAPIVASASAAGQAAIVAVGASS